MPGLYETELEQIASDMEQEAVATSMPGCVTSLSKCESNFKLRGQNRLTLTKELFWAPRIGDRVRN